MGDHFKIHVMTDWPSPQNLKELRGFLYRRCVKGYGILARPITELLKKDKFAYMSKALSPKHQQLSVYEKEMMAIVTAIDKWRPYLNWETLCHQNRSSEPQVLTGAEDFHS
ncbi:uncharacterized mitochondrial protein AtMg00860-like [Nicotiana sylvestris]|uniref:uncharacterized mitochondrial protein AtMg00860-like n=1 Tax=Nicotiana sylvestris TaxID=4096 RepID=UPI00388C50E9